MDNKEKEYLFPEFDDVTFDAIDREKVFRRIKNETSKNKIKKLFSSFSALFVTSITGVVAVIIFILFSSSTIFNNNEEIHNVAQIGEHENPKTELLIIRREEHDLADLLLLFSYIPSENNLKVLSIHRDLYVPIIDETGQERMKGKALKTTIVESSAAVKSFSKFFGMQIDSYHELTEERFVQLLNSLGGISITTTNETLSGEEVLSQLLARYDPARHTFEHREKQHNELLVAIMEDLINKNITQIFPAIDTSKDLKIDAIEMGELVEFSIVKEIVYYMVDEEGIEKVRTELGVK
ncbi:LCP family glycopolymer transferase [Sutcliffiella sp. NC1]|uniref:LCP family glycopolymer transferase n=1 Tax=Sutcliffiella sp. NC1 TaxID=3004096 RepID=UPI0022DCFD15|nr:LCP family protein [Sutcliffiella sp. NC1]WBL16607.1 LCP family protein [Sutcliffiella sp. NC1]